MKPFWILIVLSCLLACRGENDGAEPQKVAGALARIADLRKQVDGSPLDGAAYLALGDAYWTAGQYDEAQKALEKAATLRPADRKPRVSLAGVLYARGRYVAAAAVIADLARTGRNAGEHEEWLRSYRERFERLTPRAGPSVHARGRAPLALEFAAIPRTVFRRGDAAGAQGERPVRQIEVSGFEIGVFEVTVGQFKQFLQETGYRIPEWLSDRMPPGREAYPVCGVSWDDAESFAIWASIREMAVYRLPTEAEWELAARGSQEYLAPWGNEAGKAGVHANWGRLRPADVQAVLPPLARVGTYPRDRSPFGVYDMAGNVREWCLDNYDRSYYAWSPRRDPYGPTRGIGLKVLRGGAWNDPGPGRFSVTRFSAAQTHRYTGYGFRLVREVGAVVPDATSYQGRIDAFQEHLTLAVQAPPGERSGRRLHPFVGWAERLYSKVAPACGA